MSDKKIGISVISIIATVLLMIFLFVFTLYANAANNTLYTTDTVNMRSSASSSASVLKTLSANTQLTLLKDSTNGWAYVSGGNYKGYCSTAYLQVSDNSEVKMTGKVTDELNMRKGKGTSYSVVTVIPKSTVVSVLDNTDEDWAKVTYSKYTGYVSKSYLTVMFTLGESSSETQKPSATQAPTKAPTQAPTQEPTEKTYKTRTVSSANLPQVYANSITDSSLESCDKSSTLMLDVKSLNLSGGEKYKLIAFESSSNPLRNEITFSSSNTSVASVSSDGTVKGLSTGSTKITAKNVINGKTVECTVNVNGYAPTEEPTQKPTQKPTQTPTQVPTQAPTKAPTQPPTQVPTVAEKLSLSSSSATVYKGCYYQIIATSNADVTWTSSNTSVATVSGGFVYAKAAGSATITAKTSTKKATCKITVKSGTNVNISSKSATVTAGKTYLASSSTKSVSWKSSDTSVATVNNGYILGKKPGKCVISVATTSGTATCLVTVTDPAPIRFAYTSPNCAAKNAKVTLVAITDSKRTDVKFEITKASTKTTVNASSKTADGSNYIWKGTTSFSSAGTYNVKAYSKCGSSWSTCDDGATTAFVTSSTNTTTTTCENRRASDNIINLIANYEGFISSIYDDPITGDPTVGYGRVIYTGQQFYNSLSKNEAYAYLVQTVNNDGYTSKVNQFLVNNAVKFNQQQFDALVCFVYNTGTAVLNSDDELKSALLNCSDGSSGTTQYYINGSYVRIRKGPGTSYTIIDELDYGTTLKLLSTSNSSWYYVQLDDGTKGYVSSDYISKRNTGGKLDLNYVKKQNLINKFCQYHHAAGSCITGLLYRRVDEMEVFFYADYDRNYGVYKYNISFTCANNSSFHT